MKKRILITGGTGTFGKAFVRHSLKKRYRKDIYLLKR